MLNNKTVVGIFTKTPGLSEVKSRLAKNIGASAAKEIYSACLECLKESVKTLVATQESNLIFITAEKGSKDNPFWQGFQCIEQRGDSFGQKLYHAYDDLLKSYKKVIIIGGDSPSLKPDIFLKTMKLLDQYEFVIGPSMDGGFYLFSGTKQLKEKSFTNISYSTDTTLNELLIELDEFSQYQLPKVIDLDYMEDLSILLTELETMTLNSQQIILYNLLKLYIS